MGCISPCRLNALMKHQVPANSVWARILCLSTGTWRAAERLAIVRLIVSFRQQCVKADAGV